MLTGLYRCTCFPPETQQQERVKQELGKHLTMGSETSGTMLHWILQPLEKSKMMQLMQKKIGGGGGGVWIKLGHQATPQPLKPMTATSLQPSSLLKVNRCPS